MTRKQALQKINLICNLYNVKVKFKNLNNQKPRLYGYAYPYYSRIVINNSISINNMLTTAFHEIQHCLNFRNKKFFNYHRKDRNINLVKKIALRAEIYTDQQAKKLAKKHGFKKYKVTYKNNKHYREALKQYFNI